MKLLVFHENAETVPSLFDAMGARAEVRTLRVCSPKWYARVRLGGAGTGFAWGRPSQRGPRRATLVPGVRRFPRASAFALRRAYQRAVREWGPPDAVVLDSPWLSSLLDGAPEVPHIYLAADAYRYYSWPREETVRRERLMLERSRAAFAVSALLADDFRAQGATEVHQSPTAVPAAFVEACRRPGPLPSDLAGIPGPRAGCVGFINETYDWTLLEQLAEESPDVSFVFVGPRQAFTRYGRLRIGRFMARPNVHWLGPRPHEAVPAYLAGFDVLLNPLAVNDHNDRRYPLRLCEYLATDRPVLSTAVHEASGFAGQVCVAHDAEEARALLGRMLAGEVRADRAVREAWLADNTWEARAQQFLDVLGRVLPGHRRTVEAS